VTQRAPGRSAARSSRTRVCPIAAPRAEDHRPSLTFRPLRRDQLPLETLELARYLIGKIVVRQTPAGRMSGRIVEAEGYPPGDPAGHHYRGPTPRIRSMYQAPGHAYIFFNYGNHFMLNVSSEPEGQAGGILIRGLEPLEGIELMQANRGTLHLLDLTRGPGRLAAALEIDRRHDGLDLTRKGPLWLGQPEPTPKALLTPAPTVGRTVRIGISRAREELFRFYEIGNPFVSGPKRLLHPDEIRRKTGGTRSGSPVG
jgi:DNA-3-methyladenine glycosylase